MTANQQFISGEWYENEYRSKWYRHQYIDSEYPQWAKEADQYGVRFMAMCSGIPLNAKILDLGSGVGRIMQTWRESGFKDVWGVEISYEACMTSGDPRICNRSVQDLSIFKDNTFDLVSSFALLEHIDESILDEVISEISRVGVKQAHFIAHEAGTDPSHINIKTANEWMDVLDRISGDFVFVIPNPLIKQTPLFLVMPEEGLTEPIIHRLKSGVLNG